MLNWDKLYLALKEYLDVRTQSAGKIWSLAHSPDLLPYRKELLNLWRFEIHHAVLLNSLFQSLGYNQINITAKENQMKSNIKNDLVEIVNWKEVWLPKIEQMAAESFGNDIHSKLTIIIADETVNIELLKDLQGRITITPKVNNN
ncbi:MAG: hypothetical protein ACOYVD_02365 [Bacillota bacterium]